MRIGIDLQNLRVLIRILDSHFDLGNRNRNRLHEMKRAAVLLLTALFAIGQVNAHELGVASEPPIRICSSASKTNPTKTKDSTLLPPPASLVVKDHFPECPWDRPINEAKRDFNRGDYKSAEAKLLPLIREIESRDPNAIELVMALVPLVQIYDAEVHVTNAAAVARKAVKIAELVPPHTQSLQLAKMQPPMIKTYISRAQAYALTGLGEFLSDQHRDSEAEPVLQRAVALQQNNIELANTLSVLASVVSRRDYPAQKKYASAWSTLRESQSDDPEKLAEAERELGSYYSGNYAYQKAREIYQQAITLLTKNKLNTTITCAKLYFSLAEVDQAQERWLEAEKEFRDA